uniref:Uncharacterized protein n=1 Tax=Anguilla anguilla TaxID=7936 RepID=A0A0E9U9I3_ANGAN
MRTLASASAWLLFLGELEFALVV